MTRLLASDLILAARPGDPTTILNSVNGPDAKDRAYIQAMVHWCAVAGIDPFLALTQWGVETDTGESVRWNRDLNPGGVGIPANSTVQPFKIADGDEAARIHAQALYSAVTHHLRDHIPLPDASVDWFTKIWLPKVTHPNYPGVTVVDDLNTRYTANGDSHATWAWDANGVSTGWMVTTTRGQREGYQCTQCQGLCQIPTTPEEWERIDRIRRGQLERLQALASKPRPGMEDEA